MFARNWIEICVSTRICKTRNILELEIKFLSMAIVFLVFYKISLLISTLINCMVGEQSQDIILKWKQNWLKCFLLTLNNQPRSLVCGGIIEFPSFVNIPTTNGAEQSETIESSRFSNHVCQWGCVTDRGGRHQ
jgi:hypothetical protein